MAAAAFPPPPSFYKLYGNEGEQRVGTVRACLLPPEPPAPTEGEYQLFGQLYTTEHGLPPLAPGMEQLYCDSGEDVDLREEFRKLNAQLLFHFIELVHGLTAGPKRQIEQASDITLFLHNMHHLLNSTRPHQARATLERILEEQVARKKAAVESVRARRHKSREAIAEAVASLTALGLEREVNAILADPSREVPPPTALHCQHAPAPLANGLPAAKKVKFVVPTQDLEGNPRKLKSIISEALDSPDLGQDLMDLTFI
mmetsp:Transcript_16645/g.28087  ORF Transcript_16645/g.28087 Transcript_16645/m.28087 type:complete len:257 (-) Transcript_16645:207-977(-)|eukprot:CAMPEP_0198221744 /NCGR_PEP_ID=MMETSP1445-20131203/85127_1 /TAXON_ID=36898 /ORGANISM="Pyramimonas sp., Strain CCMP2087" /LENGTH=256 /DNA_ID=CAMNT_0043900007 /DNA_START=306 /DNA_END=1076 /DNA_ORIENTATION=-